MIKIKIFLILLCFFMFYGCYTQFPLVKRNSADLSDSLSTQDSSKVIAKDTIKIREREICFWTRDIWGRPELRCYDARYGRDWYWYSYYPWWNRYSSYYFGSYNYYGWYEPCPAYYYYDYTCGVCRHYRYYPGDRSWWWETSGYSGESSSASSKRTRRTGSAGIPSVNDLNTSGSSSLQKQRSSSAGESQITETPVTPQSREKARRTRTDGVPNQSEIVTPQKDNQQSLPKASQQNQTPESTKISTEGLTSQQQSGETVITAPSNEGTKETNNSPSSVPSTNISQPDQPQQNINKENKPRERRNSRSW